MYKEKQEACITRAQGIRGQKGGVRVEVNEIRAMTEATMCRALLVLVRTAVSILSKVESHRAGIKKSKDKI